MPLPNDDALAAKYRAAQYKPGPGNDIVIHKRGDKWVVGDREFGNKSDALDAADAEMHHRFERGDEHGDITVSMAEGGVVASPEEDIPRVTEEERAEAIQVRESLEEGAVVEDVPPGVPAVVGEAGPEAVIPLDDPAAVEVMADAIEEGGAGETNANDATVAAAEAVESAAEAVETVAVADAVEEVAEAQAEETEAVADAVEEVAEAQADETESAAEAVEEVSEDAAEAVEESPDQAPEIAHKWFAPLSGKHA